MYLFASVASMAFGFRRFCGFCFWLPLALFVSVQDSRKSYIPSKARRKP